MAIYEGFDKKNKLKRTFELANNIEAGRYFRLSNKKDKNDTIVPTIHLKTELPLKSIVVKGQLVLFYNERSEELWDLDKTELQKRLYKIIGFESDGRIQFRFHSTAMQQSSSNKEELTIVKFMADNNLKNSEFNYENPVPWLRLRVSNCNMLLEGIDFRLSPTGRIIAM